MCIRNVCFIMENEYTMVYSVMNQGMYFSHIKKNKYCYYSRRYIITNYTHVCVCVSIFNIQTFLTYTI